MTKGKGFNPKTLTQLAEDAVLILRSRNIASVHSKLTKIKEEGVELYKCSVQMDVKIENKDSEIVQRQITDIHKRVTELNNNYEQTKIKLVLDKSRVRKSWSYKKCREKKRMDFTCQFTFAVTNADITQVKDTSQDILKHIEDLIIVYEEDEYKILFDRGSRTASGKSNDLVEIKSNRNGARKISESSYILPENDNKAQSKDPKTHIKNETGHVHVEDKSKNRHFHFNCCNTGRKDETGCSKGLFTLLGKCLCCCSKQS